MRKMFGKDFTPAKIQMRLPGRVWGGIAMEAGLGRKRLVSLRYIQLGKIRTSFNDTERLVIELADAMTDTPANVSDDLYARLRSNFPRNN